MPITYSLSTMKLKISFPFYVMAPTRNFIVLNLYKKRTLRGKIWVNEGYLINTNISEVLATTELI